MRPPPSTGYGSPGHAVLGALPVGGVLDGLEAREGHRVLILGPDVGVMCELIRRGCTEVTELHQSDRPEPRTVDFVIVPSLTSTKAAAGVIAVARRALVASGRIFIRFVRNPSGAATAVVAKALRAQGFSGIRAHAIDDGMVLRAELAGSAGLLASAGPR